MLILEECLMRGSFFSKVEDLGSLNIFYKETPSKMFLQGLRVDFKGTLMQI